MCMFTATGRLSRLFPLAPGALLRPAPRAMSGAQPAAAPRLEAGELAAHRPALLKFAMAQLRNREQAEDAVQETLVAALKGAEGFAGGSSVRTWLTGILKHKIIDLMRRGSRERPLVLEAQEASDEDLGLLFSEDGHYAERPADWGAPDASLEQKQFFAVLELCMEGLPENTARVFAMREIMGRETAEICADLGITSANCWVLLHRARHRLRECLEKNWFAGRLPSGAQGGLR